MDTVVVHGIALAAVLALLTISGALFLHKGGQNKPFGYALIFCVFGTLVLLALGLFGGG